jgi:glycosyltransferase involved in cell wall biosynthesis
VGITPGITGKAGYNPAPHLHAVIVSYRRLPLLQACIESFLQTVTLPYSLVIVDNGSPVEVLHWLMREHLPRCLLLPRNYYPGFATNLGWQQAPAEAELLMRSDNDSLWLPGWDSELAAAFADESVGQFGPVAAGDEPWTRIPEWPVGGNTIIRRSLFDPGGLRYDETPWPEARVQEDHKLFLDIRERGYRRVWGSRPGLVYNGMRDPEYDREVAEARGRIYQP